MDELPSEFLTETAENPAKSTSNSSTWRRTRTIGISWPAFSGSFTPSREPVGSLALPGWKHWRMRVRTSWASSVTVNWR